MTKFSILDLAPIKEGGDAKQALDESVEISQCAEGWGYSRYWVAEHHNMKGIASAATSLVISHIASNTSDIRVGAGGIMLPNHTPLIIAEQFGTLATLHGNRIDLGLGRAPGTDQNTMLALRRSGTEDVSEFPRNVVELQQYLKPAETDQAGAWRQSDHRRPGWHQRSLWSGSPIVHLPHRGGRAAAGGCPRHPVPAGRGRGMIGPADGANARDIFI